MARKTPIIIAAIAAVATTTAGIPAVAQYNGKYHVVGATHRYQTGTSSQSGKAKLRTAGPGNASNQSGQGYRVKVKFPNLQRGKAQSVTSR
jgi:hypothetical protein